MAEDRLKEQTVNISKGTVIYDRGEEIHSISILAKGKVLVANDKVRSVVVAGSVLGVYDMYKGDTYSSSYTAVDDIVVVNIAAESLDDVNELCVKNSGYGGILAIYFSKRIKQLYSIYQRLKTQAVSIGRTVNEVYNEYFESCSDNFINPEHINSIDSFSDDSDLDITYLPDIEYYLALTMLDSDIQKKYFNANKAIYMHHIDEQYILLDNLYQDISNSIIELNKRFRTYALDRNSVYALIIGYSSELGKLDRDNSAWISRLEGIKSDINTISELYRAYVIDSPDIDMTRIEKMYASVLNPEEEMKRSADVKELDDTYEVIMEYVGVDQNEANEFWNFLISYDKLPEKMAVDREFGLIREGINKHFYKIYAKVFRKAFYDEAPPLSIRLFLEYGLISEKFLTETQLEDIVKLQGKKDSGDLCKVYTLYEWLTLIYEGKKEPSKNEFDLDYAEYLREQLKLKAITDKEAKELSKNLDKKLDFEIDNVFKCVNRLMITKVTAFVPILHKDNCIQGLYQSRLTSYRINTAVRKILDIDYSLFSREMMYSKPESGITKDFVMREAYPDVILFPCYGNRGVMWRDITGKKRDTEGRIMYPILFEGDEYVNLVGVLGRFRWELCKTIQGIKWNDIRIKSLTSEYQDYIQFYRKNSNLSDEWKDKVNRQIKSARSNTREIFVGDYSEWILRESTGGMRISKPSREIMATYCPFSKAIRENLERMPIFATAMKRFNIENKKKNKEYDAKIVHIKQKGYEVPEEIIKTKEFYTK